MQLHITNWVKPEGGNVVQSLLAVDRRSAEMMYSIEQRVFIVETFARKKTNRKCIRKFCRKYPDLLVPTVSCVSKLVKKWWATGSVCDKKKQSERIVLTDETVWDIEARPQISP
jgi:hypothetical protein